MTTAGSSPLVGIVGGSRSDFPTLEAAVAVLHELGVPSELRVVTMATPVGKQPSNWRNSLGSMASA